MNTIYTILFLILGAGLAWGARIARNFAERRSREMHQELTAPKNRPRIDLGNRRESGIKDPIGGSKTQEKRLRADIEGLDMWDEIRPIVGGWGCLVIIFDMIRGLGILSVIFSVMYLILQLFAS
jgi:hypothetical protein